MGLSGVETFEGFSTIFGGDFLGFLVVTFWGFWW